MWSNGSAPWRFGIWRLVVQIPSCAIFLPWMFFHYTPQLHGILQDFLLPRDGSRLSAKRSIFRMPIFFTFWRFPPNAQNSWREPWIPIQLLWVARLDADIWTAKPYVFEPHWLNSIIREAHFHFWQFGTLVSRISQLHNMFSLFHKFIKQSSSFGCSFFISWREGTPSIRLCAQTVLGRFRSMDFVTFYWK